MSFNPNNERTIVANARVGDLVSRIDLMRRGGVFFKPFDSRGEYHCGVGPAVFVEELTASFCAGRWWSTAHA